MITNVTIRNFKQFKDVDIELGQTVVFIGANNSGKTSALQALTLWYIGLQRWSEKRGGKSSPEKRPGVTVNRRDLISLPISKSNLLWRDLKTRFAERIDGKQRTQNIRIDIIVSGITGGEKWKCGLEFDYANEESFFCRPLRLSEGKDPDRMPVPDVAKDIGIAFLPPMSGLMAVEPRLDMGRINVLIGEGRTAEVLRNLCYQIYQKDENGKGWQRLQAHFNELFGVHLLDPQYIPERGEIWMAYKTQSGAELGLSSSGSGMMQTLLLLAYLYANPKTILLLDEPDAHLEILRQRQIYQLLTEITQEQGSQIVIASHSEIVLEEAARRDVVVAFVGEPHRMDDRGSQVLKALTDIGFDQYYQAKQKGWILFLEGPTDLAILQAFAKTLGHEAAQQVLTSPFVRYVEVNLPQLARNHFYGLREAYRKLKGVALFDRLDKDLEKNAPLVEMMWEQREIENYLCMPEVLLEYAKHNLPNDLFGHAESQRRLEVMQQVIDNITQALKTLGEPSPWSADIKASDDFLSRVFEQYFDRLGLDNQMRKANFHILARFVPANKIDPEVVEKLNAIVAVAESIEG